MLVTDTKRKSTEREDSEKYIKWPEQSSNMAEVMLVTQANSRGSVL